MKRRLMFGDCLERMKELEDNSIDMVLTSPPYDNLRTYKGSLNWDFKIFKKIAKQLYRVVKEGGVIVWVVGDATIKGSETGSSFKQALYFKKLGLNIHDTMIWQKSSCAFPETNRYYHTFEYMFVFSKCRPKTSNLIQDRKNKWAGTQGHGTARLPDGTLLKSGEPSNRNKNKIKEYGVRFDVWSINEEKNSKRWGHPAIFPEQLAHDHIISWSEPGDLIFDPMMGSGTVGKISKLLKRNFIGIEIVPEYFRIAKQRIRNTEK